MMILLWHLIVLFIKIFTISAANNNLPMIDTLVSEESSQNFTIDHVEIAKLVESKLKFDQAIHVKKYAIHCGSQSD